MKEAIGKRAIAVTTLVAALAGAPAAFSQLSPAGYAPSGFELVFQDEFSGSTLDTNKWIPAFLPHWGSDSTAPWEEARYEVSNGSIKLKVTEDDLVWAPPSTGAWGARSGLISGMYSGDEDSQVGLHQSSCRNPQSPLVPCEVWDQNANQNIKYAVTKYGYFEIRARGCEAGICTWWMLGFEENAQQNGEIDVFEFSHYAYGLDPWENNCAHFGTHKWDDPNLPADCYATDNPSCANLTSYFYGADCSAFYDWHTYGLLWNPDGISLYIDGEPVKYFSNSPNYPMVTLLDATLGLLPFPDENGPMEFEIDYFRIFKSRTQKGVTATMLNGSPGWGNVASRSVDGDTETYAQALTNNWDLQLDLGASFNVDRIDFLPNPSNWAEDYSIESSTNGTNWTTRKTVTGALGVPQSHTFSPFSARYIKFNVTSQQGSFAHAVHEVDVFTTSPMLSKVSQGKTATMLNGTPGWGHVASHAVDGSFSTYAQAVTPSTPSGFNWDLQVDLGSVFEIGRVVFSPNTHYPDDYRILVSVDGLTNWSTVREVNNGSASTQTIEGFLASGRYVKLEVDSQVGSYPHALYEFEVWAFR